MKKLVFRTWTIPIALLILCALSYAILIPKLGFYWDDWTIAYYIHFLGPSSFKAAYAIDRPLLASLYYVTTNLLGESLINWHLFALFTRWLSCLALWWALSLLWPHNKLQITFTAFLFAVYPGFQQHYIAITYSHGYLLLALFLASLGTMIWALRRPKWFWVLYLTSLLLSTYTIFTVEYFFGLELMRPLFLWLVLREMISSRRDRIKKVAAYWAPYVLATLVFLVWRISTPSPRAEISIFHNLLDNPAIALLSLGTTIIQDVLQVSLGAWRQTLEFGGITNDPILTLLKYGLIVFVTVIFTLLYLFFLRFKNDTIFRVGSTWRRSWTKHAISLALFSLLAAGIPIWMTNLRIELFFPWDRFTLAMMLGSSLLFAGTVEAFTKTRLQSVVIIAIAVGLAAGMHFNNALAYRKEFILQRDFFWQLSWRAPAIKPGTVLLMPEMPFNYNWDNSLTSPLNWIYDPESSNREFSYLLYNVESRLSSGLASFDEDPQINEIHRLIPFNGSTEQAIAILYRPPACLKVIDPLLDRYLPDKPRFFRQTLPYSNPDLIYPDEVPTAQPPVHLLGLEPEREWCYYYQKAELARQQGNWKNVVDLGIQANVLGKNYSRRNVTEAIPFIEGLAHTGQWEKAVQLSTQTMNTWGNMRLMLCEVWRNIEETTDQTQEAQSAIQSMLSTLDCSNR